MKVYYHGNFWGHYTDEPAGKEIPLHHQFEWGGRTWRIPAIYVCTSGIVVDYCIRIPNLEIECFWEKWKEKEESRHLTAEEEEQIELENPLCLHAFTNLMINGIQLERDSGCGNTWYPAHKQFIDEQVIDELMETYHCDRSDGWYFSRETFAWPDGLNADTALHSLTFHLHTTRTAHPNVHFVTEDGKFRKEIQITHPITGAIHTITPTAHWAEKLSEEQLSSMFAIDELPSDIAASIQKRKYPPHFRWLTYTLSPELTMEEFRIQDCVPSDPPRSLSGSEVDKEMGCSAIFMSSPENLPPNQHSVFSSFHFVPVSRVEWRTIFYYKECEDITIELEPSSKN